MDSREQEGFDAFRRGESYRSNPYDDPNYIIVWDAEAWSRGWNQAKAYDDYDDND